MGEPAVRHHNALGHPVNIKDLKNGSGHYFASIIQAAQVLEVFNWSIVDTIKLGRTIEVHYTVEAPPPQI